MKKFIIAICIVVLSSSLVMARPMGGHHKGGHHRLPAKHHIIHSRPHHKSSHIVGGFVAGLVGSVIGNYFINSQYQSPNYSNQQCFVMTNQLDRTQVIKCVDNTIITSNNQPQILNILSF